MRRRIWIIALAISLPFGSACSSSPAPISHPDRYAVWIEFMPADEIDDWMAWAGANRVDVNVAMFEGRTDPAYLAAVCEAAEAADVAVRLWPLLPDADGYWPNQANVTQFGAYVRGLRDQAKQDCPRLEGFMVDLEMPIDRALQLQDLLNAGGTIGDLVDFLQSGIDEVAFESARAELADLVDELHTDGYLVGASTLAMLVDDRDDGDESIAKALWTPIEGIDWDFISFQVYRSFFDTTLSAALADPSVPFTSGLVASYARSIVLHYGDRGAIDLGTTGLSGIGISAGLADAGELQADIAAALAEGIPTGRIQIYSLEGIFEHPDPEAWVAVPSPQPTPIDPNTDEIRGIFGGLDLFD